MSRSWLRASSPLLINITDILRIHLIGNTDAPNAENQLVEFTKGSTSGIFIGRLPIYASLYSYILLPWELDHLFDRTSGQLIMIGMVGLYLVFYYYQMHMIFGLI